MGLLRRTGLTLRAVITESVSVSLLEVATATICSLRKNMVLLASSEQGLRHALDWLQLRAFKLE